MANRELDHNRIVFGLRRQIRACEGRYNFLLLYGFNFTHPNNLKSQLSRRRHILLKVLLAYQLATFGG